MYLRSCSLTIKMLLLTAMVGVIVWVVSDSVQTATLSGVFRAKLSDRLSMQAENQRIMFDRYVKGHLATARLFVSGFEIRHYLDSDVWNKETKVKNYHQPPPWLPVLSVMRNFIEPRYLMLLDEHKNLREIYKSTSEALPNQLMYPDASLLSKSHDRDYLKNINGSYYIVVSEKVKNSAGVVKATMLLVSPLDEHFLIASQGSTVSDNNIIALLGGNDPLILVSSNSSLIPEGSRIDALKEHYLTIGKGFFNYGKKNTLELASFVSTDEIKSLTKQVITEERTVRAITALSFIVTFLLLMYMVTRRLQKFTAYVVNFSKNIKQNGSVETDSGDEITILENNFHRLAEAVETETAALEHQALHDPLTELPNRKLLNNRLQQEILRGERSRRPLVLIMSDLNHFKEINDTLGHHVGDLILQQAATRLFRTFRKTDSVARLGGDEFGILLPETTLEQATKLCKKAVEAFEIPFVIEGNSLSLGISMGLVECPMHGNDVNILVQRADVAMYIAKRTNSGFNVYDPDQDTHSIGRLALMTEFRMAIERHSLDIMYQPKIDLMTNAIVGAEALLRWNHPVRGVIHPDEFIPLAEQTGLIRPLTSWVLEEAIKQCKEWKKVWPDFGMSVNLSVHNLHDSSMLNLVRRLIKEYDLECCSLTLEITESDIMVDPIRAREILEALDNMNVKLSIDDFGTGYSSLAYLKQLPVGEIKIDKSFVMEMISDDNDMVIVKTTIDLAHNLGLQIVAEGVKDQKTCDYLRNLNCDIAQGYFISMPLSAKEFPLKMLSRSIPRVVSGSG